MTESEWLASEDPARMLEVLRSLGGTARQPPHPSSRKLRLFACAFWRWYAAHPQRDQQGDRARLLNACRLGEAVADAKTTREIAVNLGASWHAGAYFPLYRDGAEAARASVGAAKDWPPRLPGSEGMCYQAALLREVIGNPFRPVDMRGKLPGGKGSGIVWNPWLANGQAQSIAQAVYDGRDFAALPILADALEDAGCYLADLLAHLRSPGPHVRGCWALDLVLGKS